MSADKDARIAALEAELAEMKAALIPDRGEYHSLDHAMQILGGCLHSYAGQQAQEVARVLAQWRDKWAAAVDTLGSVTDKNATLEAEVERLHDIGVQAGRYLSEVVSLNPAPYMNGSGFPGFSGRGNGKSRDAAWWDGLRELRAALAPPSAEEGSDE